MKREVWGADRFTFRVKGRNSQRFINQAAGRGIRLAGVRWEETGFTAKAFGADRGALGQIAAAGGWELEMVARRGPGARLESWLARPGVPAGAVVFLLLLYLLKNIVWTIDFGVLEGEQQRAMRTLLADCGICEGVVLDENTLETAQTMALKQSDQFGWISLNFAGGCLWIENTAAEYQTVREETPPAALLAKADGVIVAVEAESGFALVEPGQEVKAGQRLVDDVRLDRSGNPVQQGASGKILARVQKSYTVLQPRTAAAQVLTGQSRTEQIWHLPGLCLGEQTEPQPGEIAQTTWIPLKLGRLSLPGCIQQTICWQRQEQEIHYTETQARALASRACRQQLYAEFPDAVLESEQRQFASTPKGEQCTIQYQFLADIALRSG